MRLFVPLLLLVIGSTTSANATICLRTRDIKSTTSPDGKSLKVVMHDGKVWQNQLQGGCSDLRFNGFVWVIRGPEGVCEDSQSRECCSPVRYAYLGSSRPLNQLATDDWIAGGLGRKLYVHAACRGLHGTPFAAISMS